MSRLMGFELAKGTFFVVTHGWHRWHLLLKCLLVLIHGCLCRVWHRAHMMLRDLLLTFFVEKASEKNH